MSDSSPSAAREGADITITRVFDAPRELVWRAWTDPAFFRRWWGPRDFTTPAATIDLRPGGKLHYCMRSPEGEDTWGTGTFREIVPQERIVVTDSFADEQGNVVPGSVYGMEDWPLELLITLTFAAEDGRTRFTLHHSGLPAGANRDMTAAGWAESFDKLAASLAET